LRVPLGAARVDDVQQEIRVHRFFERGAERRHERMRKLPNEPDRVGNDYRGVAFTADSPGRRIQCCE
jgi:hypothetical protein